MQDELKTKLLSLGGHTVILDPNDPYLANLVEHGEVWGGQIEEVPGEAHDCHQNSAKLVAEKPEHRFWVSGYSLSNKGNWFRHSWVWDAKRKVILESNGKREKYFGCAYKLAQVESPNGTGTPW